MLVIGLVREPCKGDSISKHCLGYYQWKKERGRKGRREGKEGRKDSVVSDSVRPHREHPTRLRSPWESPGKNTGVGCHFFLQCMKVKSESEVAQSCLTLHDPIDCSLSGSSVHGIFQARVQEWVAIAFSNELWTLYKKGLYLWSLVDSHIFLIPRVFYKRDNQNQVDRLLSSCPKNKNSYLSTKSYPS